MNFTNLSVENFNEEISNFVSIALNALIILLLVPLIVCKTFSGKSLRKNTTVKWDYLISFLLIINGLTEIFSILESSLNFCRFSPQFFDCVLAFFNVVIIVPTFYVFCVFKCQTSRRFIVCVVLILSQFLSFAILRFYQISQNFSSNNVKFSIWIFSSICNGFLCLLFVANLAAIFSKRFSVQQTEVF